MKGIVAQGSETEYFHVCAFFNSRDEQFAVLGPVYKNVIDAGAKALHIVNPLKVQDHRSRLVAAGIDAPACESCGKLEVLPWQGAFLDERNIFDKEKMLATVDKLTAPTTDGSDPLLHIMGDMDWVFTDAVGTDDIISYESEVNEVLSRNRQPAVCVYDLAQLSGTMMMDLLRTHPLTLIGGVVHENPFYTEPKEMLRELQSRGNP